MSTYTQLTQEQRYGISVLLKTEMTYTDIAHAIGVHKSTISREVRRNRGQRGYRHHQAHRLALQRRQGKAGRRIPLAVWERIEQLLRQEWSPEQIHGRLARMQEPTVSHTWIYHYIRVDQAHGGDLVRHLRCQKRRKKRTGRSDTRGQLRQQVRIDERPAVVDRRGRLGDWELDTIIGAGHQEAVVTLTERASRLTRMQHVQQRTAEVVSQAIQNQLQPIQARVRTLTADNGKEFAQHRTIATALNASFYFAHPYAAWERGTNENTNGLIRQYLPKGSALSGLQPTDIQRITDRLNNRPRKCLQYQTPNEVFFGEMIPVAVAS